MRRDEGEEEEGGGRMEEREVRGKGRGSTRTCTYVSRCTVTSSSGI